MLLNEPRDGGGGAEDDEEEDLEESDRGLLLRYKIELICYLEHYSSLFKIVKLVSGSP